MEIDFSVLLAYYGSKYFLMVIAIWFTIHGLMTAKLPPKDPYGYQPWVNRHPWAMLMLAFGLDCGLLSFMSHLKPQYLQAYYDLLIAGMPIFYTWTTLAAITGLASISYLMYRRRETHIAGGLSFASVLLAMLTLPYYYPF